jgi:hypothetical protein
MLAVGGKGGYDFEGVVWGHGDIVRSVRVGVGGVEIVAIAVRVELGVKEGSTNGWATFGSQMLSIVCAMGLVGATKVVDAVAGVPERRG